MFHPIHVSHDSLGQVCQVPLAKIPKRQFTKPFRQTETCGFDLIIYQPIGSFVLLQMGHEGQEGKENQQSEDNR